jgi:hypothetical protein
MDAVIGLVGGLAVVVIGWTNTTAAVSASIATGNGQTPLRLLVAPPLLLPVGIAWLWLFVLVVLPRQRRKQESRP